MHSEETMIHLQHMVERACNGHTGEEKEIEGILYDEVYTLVRPVYGEEKSHKITGIILKKYISRLNGRNVIDVHEDVAIYAIKSMYMTIQKNSGEIFTYEVGKALNDIYNCVSDDAVLYDITRYYCHGFESVKAYNSMPEEYKNMPQPLIILMELYVYMELSIKHISEILGVDKNVIKYNILQLKNNLIYINEQGLNNNDLTGKVQSEVQKRHSVNNKKRLKTKPYLSDDDDELPQISSYIFSRFNEKQKNIIDIAAAVVIIIAGIIIFH